MLNPRFDGRFWLLHVGTATRSVRQYRAQMARTGGASEGARRRTSRQRSLEHYYTPEELLEAMREAVCSRDEWARIAGLSPQAPEKLH
jgi:hypothetical protein